MPLAARSRSVVAVSRARPVFLPVPSLVMPSVARAHIPTGEGNILAAVPDSRAVSSSLAHEERARIVVYDVAAPPVRHLSDGIRPAGFHAVTWDGRDDDGRSVPSGFYVVRLEAGQIVQTRRVQSIR